MTLALKTLTTIQKGLNLVGSRHLMPCLRRVIDSVCRGFSGPSHWEFFEKTLRSPDIKDILMLGVYYGRDIAYMATILTSYRRTDYSIIGVDKFEDEFCKDWPEDARHLSWEEAGFGPAPNVRYAQDNLDRLGLAEHVLLCAQPAEDFLAEHKGGFDLIYIDTSHDYVTTRNQIALSITKLKPGGTLAGDDFSDEGTWGVQSAVRESFRRFEVFHEWIWSARREDSRVG
ncbi:MAG: class I SAM-dependent methyltransferase [Desulfomonilaceae bacterium]